MATPVLNPTLTAAGLALFPQPTQPGFSVTLTHVAIGTGLYTPAVDANGRGTQVALTNEVARYAISSGGSPNPYQLQIGTTITDVDSFGKSPNGQSIGEIGFFSNNVLFAVWSQPATPLFVKSQSLDVPFAYTLDVSVLPAGTVIVSPTTDPQGMAALILQHEGKADPHPQYVQKARGIGEYDPLTIYNKQAHILNPADGKTYRSLVDNNVGNLPSSYPLKWERWAFSTSELAAEFIPARTGLISGPANGNSIIRITNPDAAYLTTAGVVAGAIRIRFPLLYEAVLKLRLEVFDSSTGGSFTALITGYVTGAMAWLNLSVQILGSKADRDFTVRYGNDGTVPCIWLGELTSSWGYSRIQVSEIMVSSNADGGTLARWMTGWTVTTVTAFGAVTATVSNNLTFAQTDIPRVAGLQAALDLKAPLDSAQMTGTPSIVNTPTATTAQLALKGAAGALGNESKLRFFATFGTGNDLNPRLVASMRAGFNAGVWGKEYLDVYLNSATNDSQSDANQTRMLRMSYGGRIMVGNNAADDGSTVFQVGGNISGYYGLSLIQPTLRQAVFSTGNFDGLSLEAFNIGNTVKKPISLSPFGGRVLIGTTADDALNLLQVAGSIAATNTANGSAGLSLTGLSGFSAGVILNNATANNGRKYSVYSNNLGALTFGDETASAARLTVNPSGRVTVGSGTDDGSNLLQVLGNARTYGTHTAGGAGNATAWMTSDSVSGYFQSSGNAVVGSSNANGVLILAAANVEKARLLASGRMLIGTSTDDGSSKLQVSGAIKGIAAQHALIASNGSGTGQTSIFMTREDAPTDERTWELLADSTGSVKLRSISDGYTASQNAIIVNRPAGGGVVLTTMQLMSGGGRVLIGSGAVDDGGSVLQVAGNVRGSGEVQTTGYGLRMVTGSYGAFIRNDGSNVYMFQTASGDQFGAGNAFRPFQWNLASGVVAIDGTGAGTSFGGAVLASGLVKGTAGTKALWASNGGGSGQTSIVLSREGAPVDQKQWEMLADNNGVFALRAVNDAYSATSIAMAVARGSGYSLNLMQLMPSGGRVLIGNLADDGSTLLQVANNARIYGTTTSGAAGSVTAWMAADSVYGYFRTAGNATVGSESVNGFCDLLAGNVSRVRVLPSGRVLIGQTATDDGSSVLQVTGDAAFSKNVHIARSNGEGEIWLGQNDGYIYGNAGAWGWYSPTYGQVNYDFASKTLFVNSAPVFLTTGGTLTGQLLLKEGTATAPGLSFANDGSPDTGLYHINDGTFAVTNNGIETMRFVAGGRVLIGTQTDDTSVKLTVGGNLRVTGEVQSGSSNTFRTVFGNYGAFIRNDGSAVYLMQTASGDQYGGYAAVRPFYWNLTTGAVNIDGTGASTTFGGPVIVSNGAGIAQPLAIRASAGQQRNLQFQTGTANRWQIMTDSVAESGSNVGSDFYIQGFTDAGAFLSNPFKITRSTGRVLISQGLDSAGTITVSRSSGEGDLLLGQNDGYFFGNTTQAGWFSGTVGSWAYNFSQKNLYVNNNAVWHAGNLTPGNYVAKGGDTMTGRLTMAPASSYGEIGLVSTDRSAMFIRGRSSGGGMEWVNSAYNNVVARMDDLGNLYSNQNVYTGMGSAWLGTDGNVYGSAWGGWLSSWLSTQVNNLQNNINAKANAGARVAWDSGVVEFGYVDDGQNIGQVLVANPYVMVGLRTSNADDKIYLQGMLLRNQ